MQDGQQLVNASGATLAEIVSSVESVCQMMKDISSAAQEQTSGIEQVNTAITEMDEMTQQNAALVEQASAAGHSMAEQADALDQMVKFFTVSESTSVQSGSGKTTAIARKTVNAAPAKQAVSEPLVANRAIPTARKLPDNPPAAQKSAPSTSSYTPQSTQDDDEWEEF